MQQQQQPRPTDSLGAGCARGDEEIPGVSADLYASIPELKHISIAKGSPFDVEGISEAQMG